MESNVQTKVYKLTDRMDKYHSSYTSSKYSSYTHSSNNENKSKSRNPPRGVESSSTTYKHYLNSHDVPQSSQTHRDNDHYHHTSTTASNNVHNNDTNNNNTELINSMYNHSTTLIANATVFPKSRIQSISTKEFLNIKSYFEKHILKNPKSIAEKRSSLLISDISSLEGHTNTFVLPRLKIDEFIDSKQVSENVLNISMKWPLEKSGYILRKNIYTKESNNNFNNSNPSVMNKIKHPNFLKKDRSSSLKGKIQEQAITPSSSKWLIFYVEIRGPYIFFYQLIRKKPISTTKPVHTLKSKHSVMNKMSIENIRKNLVEKPLSRILSMSKSSSSRRQAKMIEASPSSTSQTTDDDNFIPTYPTSSNQHHHHASLICTVNDISGPLEILSAKRVLVHYIPLYYSIVTPVITDNNPNILALSTIQGIDLKEEEPKYLLDQMLIEISNIGVSHVHSFIEESSIVENKSFNLTSLMQTEVQNWHNSLKQGSFIHSDDDLFESISFIPEHKNVTDHYESRRNTSPSTETITEDLFMDFKNYTFPHVPKTESSSNKEKKDKDSDKIKSIQNQYTQKFYNYCKQIDDAASYHSSSSSNNSISSNHKKSDNSLSDALNEKKENMDPSTNVFKNRPKAYSISSENPLAKKTTTGNIVEKTKTRKPSIDTDLIPEDGKKLLNNENLLSPSRYYRKYSMPEFINNFSSFSNSKYIKSSSSSIKSTNSANKIESSSNKKSVDFHDISPNKLENSNKKVSTDLRDIMHNSNPTESKSGPVSTDVSQKFAKTSLARNNSRKGATHISEITNRYKNAEPPTPISDRYKNIDLDSPIVDAQVPTPSLFINNNVINLNEITDQANELINAGSSKKVKKEKKSKRNKDKVKKSLIGAPVLLSHDGANGSSLPGQVGSKVLSIPTRPLNVASKDLKTYSNPTFVEYASNPTKENRNKLINSSSAANNALSSPTTISTSTGVSAGTDKTSISSPQNQKKLEKSKFYSPFINALSKTNHNSGSPVTSTYKTSIYSSSPKSSKMNLDFNAFSGKLSKTNSKESLRFNKNEISSPSSVSKPSKLGSDNKNTYIKSRDVAIDDIDEGLKLDLKNNLKFEEKLNQFLEGDHSSFSSKKNEEIVSKKKERNALNIDTSFYIKSFDSISPAFKSATLNRFSIPSTVSENLPEVPILIQKCVELVEKIGLRTEGIYRLSGNSATIQSLRKKFEVDPFKVNLISPNYKDDSKDSIDGIHRRYSHAKSKSTTSIPLEFSSIESPNNLYDNDIHVVTGCLKSYLRDGIGEDHIPVCTFDLYKEFIHASEIKDYRERMIKFQDVVHMLPGLNFVTLRFICQHLYRVSLYSTINKMTVKNLAIVFGPTLLKPSPVIESAQRLIKDMKRQCEAVEILVENHEFLFGKIEYEEVSDNEEKISTDYDKKTAAKVQEYINNNNTYDARKPVSSSKYVLTSSSTTTPTSSSPFRMTSPSSPLSSTKHFIGGGNNNTTNKINSPISSSAVMFTRDFFDKKSNPQSTTTTTSATTTKTTTSYKLYSDKKSTTASTTPSSTIATSYKLHSDKKPYNSSTTNTTTSTTATYKPYSITTNLGISKSNNSNKRDIRSSTPTKLSDMSSSMEPINLNLEKSIFDSLKLNTSTSESSPKPIHKNHDKYKESTSSPKINNRKNQDEQDETLVTKNLILNIMKEDNALDSNNNNGSKISRTLNKFNYANSDKNSKKSSKIILPNEDSLIKPPRLSSKLNSVVEDNINIKPLRSVNKFNSSSYKPLSKITNTGSSLRKEMNRPELPLKNDEFINKNDIKKINIGSYKKEYSSDYETLKMETNSLPKYNDNTASPSSEVTSLSNEEEIIYLSNAKTIFDNNSHKSSKTEGKTLSSSLSKHNDIYDELFERSSEKTEKSDILLPSVIAPSLVEHENEFEDEILSPTKDYNKTHLDLTNQSDVSFEMDKDFTIISNEKNSIAYDDSVQFSSIVVPGESKLDESILKFRKEKKLKELNINKDFKTDLELGSLSSEINKEFNNIISHGHHVNEENNFNDNGNMKMDIIIKRYNEKEEHINNNESMANKLESSQRNDEFMNTIQPLKENKKQLQQSIEKVKEEIKEEVNEEVEETDAIGETVEEQLIEEVKNEEPVVVEEIIEEQPTEEIKEETIEKPILVEETVEEQPTEEVKEETIEESVIVVEETFEQPTEEVKEEIIEEPVIDEETVKEQSTEEEVKEETVEKQPIEEVKEEIIEEPIIVEETVEEQPTEEVKEETIEEQPTEEVKEETIEEQPTEEVKEETIEEQPIEEIKEETIEKPVVVEETIEEQPTEEVKEEIIEEPVIDEETVKEQSTEEEVKEETIEEPIIVEETVEEQPTEEVKEETIEEQSIEEINEETIEEPVVVEESVEEKLTEEVKEEINKEPIIVEETVEEHPTEEVKEETIEEPVVVEETVEEKSTEEIKKEINEESFIAEETEESLVKEESTKEPNIEETIEEQSTEEIVEVSIPEIRTDEGLWWIFIKPELNDEVEESVIVKETIEEQPIEEIKEDIIEESVVVEETFEEQRTEEVNEEINEVSSSEIRTDNGLWWLFAKSELSEGEEIIEEQGSIIEETIEEKPTEVEEIIEDPVIIEETVEEQSTEEQPNEEQPNEEVKEEIIKETDVAEETIEEQPIEEPIEEPIVDEEIDKEQQTEEFKEEVIEAPFLEIRTDNGLWWLFAKPELRKIEDVKEEIIKEQPIEDINGEIIKEIKEIRADNGLWWLYVKSELNEVEEIKDEVIEEPIDIVGETIKESIIEETVEKQPVIIKETVEEQPIEDIIEEINEENAEASISEIRADNGLWWIFAKSELNEVEDVKEVKEKIIEEPIVVEEIVEEQPIEKINEEINEEINKEIVEVSFQEIRADNGLWWLFAKPGIKEQYIDKAIEVPQDEQPIKECKIEDSTIVKETREEFELDENDFQLIEKHLSEVIKGEDLDYNLGSIPEEKSEDEFNILSDIIEEETEEIDDFESNKIENSLE